MTIQQLDAKTRAMIPAMMAKGYRYIVQIEIQRQYHLAPKKPFGEPLFFKSADHVGPFLRTEGRGDSLTVAWSINLNDAKTPITLERLLEDARTTLNRCVTETPSHELTCLCAEVVGDIEQFQKENLGQS